MDITKMSVQELKALAYDLLVQSQKIQSDLNLVNNEIVKQTKVEAPVDNVSPQEGEATV